jgi:hypothetical protein
MVTGGEIAGAESSGSTIRVFDISHFTNNKLGIVL